MKKGLIGNMLNEYEEWLSPILKNLTLILREFIVDTLDLEKVNKLYIESIDNEISKLEDDGKINFSRSNLDLFYSCKIISYSKVQHQNYINKFAFKEIYNFNDYEFELFKRLHSLRNREAHWIFPMTNRGVLSSILTILDVVDLVGAKITMPEWYNELKKHTDFIMEKVVSESGLSIPSIGIENTNVIKNVEIEINNLKGNTKMNIENEKSGTTNSVEMNEISFEDSKKSNKIDQVAESSVACLEIENSDKVGFIEIIDEFIESLHNLPFNRSKSLIYWFYKIKGSSIDIEHFYTDYENTKIYFKDEKLVSFINYIHTTCNLVNQQILFASDYIERGKKGRLKNQDFVLEDWIEFLELMERISTSIQEYFDDLKLVNRNIILLSYPHLFKAFLNISSDCEFAEFIDANIKTPSYFKRFRDEYFRLLANYAFLRNEDYRIDDGFPDRSLDEPMNELSIHLNSIRELELKYDSNMKKTPINVVKPAILFKSRIIQKAEVLVSYE